jgi:hypothetical protein
VGPNQLGAAEADSDGISLGAALPAGAADSVVGDVPEPDGEHATRAAPIATINRIRFSMEDLLGFDDARCAPTAAPFFGTSRP